MDPFCSCMNKLKKDASIRSPKKLYIFVSSILLVLIFLPSYVLRREISDLTLVVHKDQLIILFEETTYGSSSSYIVRLVSGLVGRSPQQILRQDLVVYSLQDKVLKKYIVQDVPYGAAYLDEDCLYYQAIVRRSTQSYKSLLQDWPPEVQTYRWTGNGMERLPAAENIFINRRLNAQNNYGFGVSKKWSRVSRIDVMSRKSSATTDFRKVINLGAQNYTFTVRQRYKSLTGFFEESYSLEGPGLKKPNQILIIWHLSDISVSRNTFLKFTRS